jgi:hypothetical protein
MFRRTVRAPVSAPATEGNLLVSQLIHLLSLSLFFLKRERERRTMAGGPCSEPFIPRLSLFRQNI